MVGPSVRSGLRDALVLIVPVGAFGVAFGALAIDAGLAPALVMLTSVIVISGAAQLAMVGLLSGGAWPVLAATTGLALRHVPMSARLAGLLGPRPPMVRAALAWVLVDETFGLTIAAADRGEPDVVRYKFATDAVLYASWVGGTGIGAAFGATVDPEQWGTGVFFALLFLGLAAPLVRTRRDWIVVVVTMAVAVGSTTVVSEAWRITAAAAVAAVIGAVIRE